MKNTCTIFRYKIQGHQESSIIFFISKSSVVLPEKTRYLSVKLLLQVRFAIGLGWVVRACVQFSLEDASQGSGGEAYIVLICGSACALIEFRCMDRKRVSTTQCLKITQKSLTFSIILRAKRAMFECPKNYSNIESCFMRFFGHFQPL